MEPITHLLTGACISRAGLNRKTALATATLVISAEIPDIDIVASFWGRVEGFAHHRGFTHTFIGVSFDAALAVGLVYLWWRIRGRRGDNRRAEPDAALGSGAAATSLGHRPRWKLLFLYGCLGALSHIALDFTNNYGVRPLAPFSWRWFSWDIIFIVEPVFLFALLLGLLAPSLFRLVHEEIGARRATAGPRGQVGAVSALAFLILWTGFRDFEHRGAVAALNARIYQGAEPVRVSAYPYWVTPFQWHGVVETAKFFALVPVNSQSGEVDPEGKMRVRYKPAETAVTLAAEKSYLGRVYLDWAQYPITEVEKRDDFSHEYTVRFIDLRYAYPERDLPSLTASVDLDGNLKVVAERFDTPVKK